MDVHAIPDLHRTSGDARLPSTRVRRATAADAAAIASLYLGCYASADGRNPAENYPYPRVMDPTWVAAALHDRRMEATVAERRGRVCGAVAAARVGAVSSGLVEFFGLATEQSSRGQGLATRLLQRLCNCIGESMQVAIGEVRTADPAAAQVVRKTVLEPVGFEPFVHFMLAGAESMIAVWAASDAALQSRSQRGATTARAHQLAELALLPTGLKPPPARDAGLAAEIPREAGDVELVRLREESGTTRYVSVLPRGSGNGLFFTVHQTELLAGSPSVFERRRYALRWRGDLKAQALVVRDSRDHRARILDVEARERGMAAVILRRLAEALEQEAQGAALVIVAEVSTEDVSMQAALEAAGFRPTAYFPAVVHKAGIRFDAVQYCRFSGATPTECANCLASVEWPRARRIAQHVLASLECA